MSINAAKERAIRTADVVIVYDTSTPSCETGACAVIGALP